MIAGVLRLKRVVVNTLAKLAPPKKTEFEKELDNLVEESGSTSPEELFEAAYDWSQKERSFLKGDTRGYKPLLLSQAKEAEKVPFWVQMYARNQLRISHG